MIQIANIVFRNTYLRNTYPTCLRPDYFPFRRIIVYKTKLSGRIFSWAAISIIFLLLGSQLAFITRKSSGFKIPSGCSKPARAFSSLFLESTLSITPSVFNSLYSSELPCKPVPWMFLDPAPDSPAHPPPLLLPIMYYPNQVPEIFCSFHI